MATKSKANKAPKLFLQKGQQALALRKKLGLNQSQFWCKLGVTQSGGSRYETGRNMPHPVQLLLHVAYAPEAQAEAMLAFLRNSA